MKKSIVQQLSARGVLKESPDFKDTFNNVYRGTCFALVSLVPIPLPFRVDGVLMKYIYDRYLVQRARMKAAPIDSMVVNQLVGIHVGMYVSVDG